MAKNRKGLGRQFGEGVKVKRVEDAMHRVKVGRGSSADLDIAFEQIIGKPSKKMRK